MTPDTEFYGRFRRGVLTGSLSTTFEFVFDFDMHPVQVRITMRESDRAGEFWIIVEPKRDLAPRPDAWSQDQIANKFLPVKRDGVDLSAVSFDFSRCDQDPIAFCGAVQPFDCLLVLDAELLSVTACSANTGQYLGREPESLIGMQIGDLLPDRNGGLVDRLRATGNDQRFCPNHFQVPAPSGDLEFHIRLQAWRGRLLLEIEPDSPSAPSPGSASGMVPLVGLRIGERLDRVADRGGEDCVD